jgi:hypothetical protein
MRKLGCFFLAVAAIAASPPAVKAETVFGLDPANRIFFFDSATPGAITFLHGGSMISGLPDGEMLLGIDLRPVATGAADASLNGILYALGSTNRLYTIDVSTGTATPVGTAGSFTLSGSEFGMDFNPAADRLRVVSELDQNLRLNTSNGALANVDTPLSYLSGDVNFGMNPNVVGAAYTNNFGGATVTTLYGIDSNLDVLVRQGGVDGSPSPNGGQLTTLGALGVNTINYVGFDISGISGTAYASLTSRVGPLDTSSDFYRINLSTGAATLIGSIGAAGGPGAFLTRDIAAPVGQAVPEPRALGMLALGAVLLGRRVLRKTGVSRPVSGETPLPL